MSGVLHQRGHIVCWDVIKELKVRRGESRGLIVHKGSLVDTTYTKEVWFVWQPVAGTSLTVPYHGSRLSTYGREERYEVSRVFQTGSPKVSQVKRKTA